MIFEISLLILAAYLLIRIIQRIYYLLIGHTHYLSYNPKTDFELFLKKNDIQTETNQFVSQDSVEISYQKIGSGEKIVLLLNGVGTGTFMWLPIYQSMYLQNSNIFNEITIIIPSYRGLFGNNIINSNEKSEVIITIPHCIEDINDLLNHLKIKQFNTIIGWSTGAQITLNLLLKYPHITKYNILLNPSLGYTLHYSLQPFFPFPKFIRNQLSLIIHNIVKFLKPLIFTYVWDILQKIAFSIIFRFFLEFHSFINGYPPEQGVYFHQYMIDTFNNRQHTLGLLNLIISLDYPSITNQFHIIKQPTTIISGYTDFITGIYFSYNLEKQLKYNRHVIFTMGSHWLLLEWPTIVATEILHDLKERK